MTTSVDVRAGLIDAFRRDLVGPGLQDGDIAKERLKENPSRWYLTGFLAPAEDPLALDGAQPEEDDPSAQEEMETDVEDPAEEGAGGAAGDDAAPETPSTKRRFVPDSAALQRKGGGLRLERHARLFTISTPDGDEEVRALTVFLVNRRTRVHRFYGDVSLRLPGAP
jgi:hypothetical protein